MLLAVGRKSTTNASSYPSCVKYVKYRISLSCCSDKKETLIMCCYFFFLF